MAIEPFSLWGAADLAKAAQLELDNSATANDQGQELEDQEDLASRPRVSQSLCCGYAGARRGLCYICEIKKVV